VEVFGAFRETEFGDRRQVGAGYGLGDAKPSDGVNREKRTVKSKKRLKTNMVLEVLFVKGDQREFWMD
jgi:hypothetical protein